MNYSKATNNDKENAGKDRICWGELLGGRVGRARRAGLEKPM